MADAPSAYVVDPDNVAYLANKMRRARFVAQAHRFETDETGVYKGLPMPTLCGDFLVKREGREIPHAGGVLRMCVACDAEIARREGQVRDAVAEHAAKCGCDKAPALKPHLVG